MTMGQGLVVYWYDFICFGIVGVSVLGSLYVIWRTEGAGKTKNKYENYLLEYDDDHPPPPPPINVDYSNYSSSSNHGYYVMSLRGHVSSSQLWTSCWRGLHPAWLLAFRFVSFAVMSGFLVWDILQYDASIFVYYTEWTFAFVILYFAIGTVVSANGCMLYYSNKPSSDNEERGVFDVEQSSISTNGLIFRTKQFRDNIKFQSRYDQEAILQRAGFWGYLMQTAYQTCAGAVILTDIIFWCVIVPFLTNAHLTLNLLMGCMHTLNAVFLLLDTSVNSLPFPWFRLSYFVLWSCCYVIFQWVIHACGFSWWPYPFLELSTPWAPLWYFFLAMVHIPCYGLYSLLVQVKNSIFSKLWPHAFVRPC